MSGEEQEVVIGRIIGAHGLRGWVQVFSYTDPAEQILDYAPWLIVKGGSRQEVEIVEGRQQGKRLVARPRGFESRNEAELLTGAEVRVSNAVLPNLDEGEYYWHQLEGLNVINGAGELLGVVDHLMDTGANDVLVVASRDDSEDQRERLIPYVEGEIIEQVDIAGGRILVNWEKDF